MRSATQREYTTPTLKPGTSYEVEVWTVTSIGIGTGTRRTAITPQGMTYTTYIPMQEGFTFLHFYAAPGPVMALNVTSHPTTIALIVTWQPPTGPTRPLVEGYKVRYREAPDGQWSSVVQISAQRNQYTLSGLQPATTYEVQVWAYSSIGEDLSSKRMDSRTTGGRESLLL